MARITSISPISLGLNLGVLGLGVGGAAAFLVALTPSGPLPMPVPAWVLPVVGLAGGLLAGAVLALIFNAIALVTGGLECTVAMGWKDPPRPRSSFTLTPAMARAVHGGGIVLECETGGVTVPPLEGGEALELRREDGSGLRASVACEERHVRRARPGRVAFALEGGVSLDDVKGIVEVRLSGREAGPSPDTIRS